MVGIHFQELMFELELNVIHIVNGSCMYEDSDSEIKRKANVIKGEKWIIYLNVFHRVCN